MLVRILLFLLISSTSWGYIITTEDNVTLESLSPTSRDTVIIAGGDTVRVVGSWRALDSDTTCLAMYVREGGVLQWVGGSRANFGSLWLGGKSGFPFSSGGGGRLYMSSGDTLGLWNTNVLGSEDFNFRGGDCGVHIDGGSASSRAVVMGMSAWSRPYIYNGQSDGVFEVNYARFYRLGTDTWTPGITLGSSGSPRTGSGGLIGHSVFDSAGVYFYGAGATVVDGCSLYVDHDWPYSPLYLYGSKDTVRGSYIEHDNRNYPTPHGSYMMLRIYADSSYIYNTALVNVNTNGEGGRAEYGVRLYANYVTLRGVTVDGCVWGINSNGDKHDILIDGCLIINNKHEGILRLGNGGDSCWTIQGSVFRGNGHEVGSGYAALLMNTGPDDPEYLDYRILYNTFCDYLGGDIPVSFRNHVGGVFTSSGVWMVGNIFIGNYCDIRIASFAGGTVTRVEFEEFKDNAYDYLRIESGCSVWIKDNAYAISDSNLDDQSQYGFVDSAGYDFRLAVGSPMLDAGDSLYWAQVFGGGDDDPGNIGYYQGPGVDPGNPIQEGYVDSLHNDYTGEEDSVLIRYVTGSQSWPDSVVVALSTLGFPDSAASSRLARVYNPNSTDTLFAVVSVDEPGSLFVSLWTKDQQNNWSSRHTASTFFDSGIGIYDIFHISDVLSIDPDSIRLIVGNIVPSPFYDTTIMRYGDHLPLDISDGSLLLSGGLIINDTMDCLIDFNQPGWLYIRAFASIENSGWFIIGTDSAYINDTMPGQCEYVVGDANNSGIYNGFDITFGVAYFKGSAPPAYECECTLGQVWHVAGDVNADCGFSGNDITYGVRYFKGGPGPDPCPDCPPR
ncbi:MAG: right-handed parallel beta-helix repeat-containing protein [Candidatus Zixiibacteriota bacterium]|nr:MAG: right-handed parallel beta-helix repeat-containing protein [candidate division Zixibacteria bacterium]